VGDLRDKGFEIIEAANRIYSVLECADSLTEWEAYFIESIHRMVLRGRELSSAQWNTFLEIEEKVNEKA